MPSSSLLLNARWLAHALGRRPNPLRRRLDRVTAAVMALLLCAAFLAIPVAAALGGVVHQHRAKEAAEVAATRQQVEAVVLGPPETRTIGSGPDSERTELRAPVQYNGKDGQARTGEARVRAGIQAGNRIPVWVDQSERVTGAPPSAHSVLAYSVSAGVFIMLGLQIACFALIGGVRSLANFCAMRAWRREWEIVQPQWTRRRR